MTASDDEQDGRNGGIGASRPVATAMLRGGLCRCPACGNGRLFGAYLKVADHCPACGEAMHHHRSDDAPPYVTIFVLGHVMVPLILAVDLLYEWPMWLNLLVWFPVIVGLALVMLPVAKGALIGLQWATRMHGFAEEHATPETRIPAPSTAPLPAG